MSSDSGNDLDKKFKIKANASNYTTRGVLSMKCSNKLWRPVAFISKSLSDTKKIHNKEILAIIRYLEVWKHFLEEVKIKFWDLDKLQESWILYEDIKVK